MKYSEKKRFFNFKDIQDPFNPENYIDGNINRETYEFNITKINGIYCSQRIATTPVMPYPFDNNKFHLPHNIDHIEAYEKIDGSNILVYTYKDAHNKTFVSFKTRRRPFIFRKKNIDNIDYYALMMQIIQRYPQITQLPLKNNGCNIALELYGKLNDIAIEYEILIDVKIIFGIKRKDNGIIPPSQIFFTANIEKAEMHKIIRMEKEIDLEKEYNSDRERLEKELTSLGEGKFKGEEGLVWYCIMPDYTSFYKVKPPSIEKLHWSFRQPDFLTKTSVITTLKIAREDLEKLTVKNVLEYFLSEWKMKDIKPQLPLIKQKIEEINKEKDFNLKIRKIYENEELNFKDNKKECMHFFSKKFGNEKRMITQIYLILEKYYGKTD